MHTVVGRTVRSNFEPAVVCGHLFPANTHFKLLLGATHRDPRVYKDPNEFQPSRWESESAPAYFFGFGAGPHNCVGQKLALIEMKVSLN
jgi:cytochrome P450